MDRYDKFNLCKILADDFFKKYSIYIDNCITGKHSYMNKNYGKSALMREITMLRNELLNLKKQIENDNPW